MVLKFLKQIDKESKEFTDVLKIVRREKDMLARIIIEKAERIIPEYRKVCDCHAIAFMGR